MPFYRYSFEVPLPPEVVAEKIRAVTGEWPPAWKRLWVRYTDPGSEIFWGGVDGNGFRLQRIIRRSRNSFEPLISGRIEPFGAGSRVSITMFFRPATAIFIALYLLVSRQLLSVVPWRLPRSVRYRNNVSFWIVLVGKFLCHSRTSQKAVPLNPGASAALVGMTTLLLRCQRFVNG